MPMNGILPIYKPVGLTSFDVIREFKRHITRTVPDRYKIGHGGTLDPFADGVLLLLLGKATKRMNELSALKKTYKAVAVLGSESDTLDSTGTIVRQISNPKFSNSQIEESAKVFVGEIEQEIPNYSATKINGVPRYKLARRGEVMERKSKLVTIYDLTIEKVEGNEVTFTTTVSSGTYIRQLSYDIFKSLGIASYLSGLTRTKIGEYTMKECGKIEDFKTSKWQDMIVRM